MKPRQPLHTRPQLVIVLLGAAVACIIIISTPLMQFELDGNYVLMEVISNGGLCQYGGCRSEVRVWANGSYQYANGPLARSGMVPHALLQNLKNAVSSANFNAIKSVPFTDICPIAYDGMEHTYVFSMPYGKETISDCTYQLEYQSGLFKAAQDINNWAFSQNG